MNFGKVTSYPKKNVVDFRPKILIVEDNPQELFLLEERMSDLNMTVYTAGSATEAIKLDSNIDPDLTIIDYHLPDCRGDFLVHELRAKKSHRLLVVLSNDNTQESILQALNSGADTYWCKPMVFREMIHRIHSLLCSHHRQQKLVAPFEINGYKLDPYRFKATVTRDNKVISLTRNEGKILSLLIPYVGKTVKYEALQTVTRNDLSTKRLHSSSIKNIICSLRKKLPFLNIVTVSKQGYMLSNSSITVKV